MSSDDDEYLIGIVPRTVHYHHNPGGELTIDQRQIRQQKLIGDI